MWGWNKRLDGLEVSSEEEIDCVEFGSCEEGWEKLKEGFVRVEGGVFGKGGSGNSGVGVVYKVFIKIGKGWVEGDFDYGRCLNYKESKWRRLVKN